MAFKRSVAVFDACILYPFHLRNIIVQAAVDRLVEARWTDAIHDEWIPDAFLSALYDEVPDLMIGSLANARRNLTKTRASALEFIDILKSQRLARLARRAQKHAADL